MPVERRKPRSPSGRVSPRLYLIVGALLIALPLLGYFVSNWYVTKKKWAEECFTKPVAVCAPEAEEWQDPAAVAFSPDGRRVALGTESGYPKLCIWEPESGKKSTLKLRASGGRGRISIRMLAFLRDGRRVLVGGDSIYNVPIDPVLKVLDTAGERPPEDLLDARLGGWRGRGFGLPKCVAIFDDGRRALISGGGSGLTLWDMESLRPLEQLASRSGAVYAVAVSPDGRRALLDGAGGVVILWDLAAGEELRRLAEKGGGRAVMALAFSRDARRALAASTKALRVWDTRDGRLLRRIDLTDETLYAVAFLPDGRRVLLGCGGYQHIEDGRAELSLWDIDSGRPVRHYRLPAHKEARNSGIRAVAVSPDGRRAVSAGWWVDAAGELHTELLLWRLPDEMGFRLLGTQDLKEQGGGGE